MSKYESNDAQNAQTNTVNNRKAFRVIQIKLQIIRQVIKLPIDHAKILIYQGNNIF